VQKVYEYCWIEKGEIAFMDSAFACATDNPQADFNRVQNDDLPWQLKNRRGSILEARSAYREYLKTRPGSLARRFLKVKIMWHLLDGQQHEAETMARYRACYREDADKLFAMMFRVTGS